jgi:hypothetical protein
MSTSTPTTYRWPLVQVVRSAGLVFVVLGVLWVVVALVHPVLGGAARAVVIVVSLLTLIVTVGAAALAARPPKVLTLTADGYRIHHLRGGGVSSAKWTDVAGVTTVAAPDGPVIVVDLGARRSVLPVSLLGPRSIEAQRQIHELLNTAYGYRRLDL